MFSLLPRRIEVLTATLLTVIFLAPGPLLAQSHVVSSAEVQEQVLAASQERLRNEETVRQFVSSAQAEKAIKSAGIDPAQVTAAIPTLNDQELAEIASRAEKAQADFAAGRMSDRDLLIILVAVAVVILVVVAVR